MAGRRKTVRRVAPTEKSEQELLFEWLEWQSITMPELALCYHIPNEGKRSRRAGAELVYQGMKKGVPDICLPVPRGGYGALYIEMKRTRGGKVSKEQTEWIEALNKAGNKAVICKGFDEARKAILRYMKGAEQ